MTNCRQLELVVMIPNDTTRGVRVPMGEDFVGFLVSSKPKKLQHLDLSTVQDLCIKIRTRFPPRTQDATVLPLLFPKLTQVENFSFESAEKGGTVFDWPHYERIIDLLSPTLKVVRIKKGLSCRMEISHFLPFARFVLISPVKFPRLEKFFVGARFPSHVVVANDLLQLLASIPKLETLNVDSFTTFLSPRESLTNVLLTAGTLRHLTFPILQEAPMEALSQSNLVSLDMSMMHFNEPVRLQCFFYCLENLPQTLQSFRVTLPKRIYELFRTADWHPMLVYLWSSTTLKTLSIEFFNHVVPDGYDRYPNLVERIPEDDARRFFEQNYHLEHWTWTATHDDNTAMPMPPAIELALLLNRAGRRKLLKASPGEPAFTNDDWLEALDHVKDSVSALFYFLRANPSIVQPRRTAGTEQLQSTMGTSTATSLPASRGGRKRRRGN